MVETGKGFFVKYVRYFSPPLETYLRILRMSPKQHIKNSQLIAKDSWTEVSCMQGGVVRRSASTTVYYNVQPPTTLSVML
jgi:hypothetical protein